MSRDIHAFTFAMPQAHARLAWRHATTHGTASWRGQFTMRH